MPDDNPVARVDTELRELSLEEQQAAVRQRIEQRERAYYGAAAQSADHGADAPPGRKAEPLCGRREPLSDGRRWRDQIDVHDERAAAELDASMNEAAAADELARRRLPGVAQGLAAEDALSRDNAARHAALQLSDQERREVLAAAICEHSEAQALADAADAAVERARQRVDAVDAALEDYRDLDSKIVAYHTAEIKRGTDDPLPHSLATAQDSRGRLLDRLDASHKARAQLVGEAREAHAAAEQAAQRRSTAALHVISAFTGTLAIALAAVDARAALLRQMMLTTADARVVIGGVTSPIGLTPFGSETLLKPRADPRHDDEFGAVVKQWFGELQHDAEATLQLE